MEQRVRSLYYIQKGSDSQSRLLAIYLWAQCYVQTAIINSSTVISESLSLLLPAIQYLHTVVNQLLLNSYFLNSLSILFASKRINSRIIAKIFASTTYLRHTQTPPIQPFVQNYLEITALWKVRKIRLRCNIDQTYKSDGVFSDYV